MYFYVLLPALLFLTDPTVQLECNITNRFGGAWFLTSGRLTASREKAGTFARTVAAGTTVALFCGSKTKLNGVQAKGESQQGKSTESVCNGETGKIPFMKTHWCGANLEITHDLVEVDQMPNCDVEDCVLPPMRLSCVATCSNIEVDLVDECIENACAYPEGPFICAATCSKGEDMYDNCENYQSQCDEPEVWSSCGKTCEKGGSCDMTLYANKCCSLYAHSQQLTDLTNVLVPKIANGATVAKFCTKPIKNQLKGAELKGSTDDVCLNGVLQIHGNSRCYCDPFPNPPLADSTNKYDNCDDYKDMKDIESICAETSKPFALACPETCRSIEKITQLKTACYGLLNESANGFVAHNFFENSCFSVNTKKVRFNGESGNSGAKDSCTELAGGHLAYAKNFATYIEAVTWLSQVTTANAWIGLERTMSAWQWLDGTPATTLPWMSASVPDADGKDCGKFFEASEFTSGIVNEDCEDHDADFICQYDVIESPQLQTLCYGLPNETNGFKAHTFFDNLCFSFNSKSFTFKTTEGGIGATDSCTELNNGHLAYVKDAATFTKLMDWLKTDLGEGGYMWIGLQKTEGADGDWEWLNGMIALATDVVWHEGEPDDNGGIYMCGSVWDRAVLATKCDNTFSLLCQYE